MPFYICIIKHSLTKLRHSEMAVSQSAMSNPGTFEVTNLWKQNYKPFTLLCYANRVIIILYSIKFPTPVMFYLSTNAFGCYSLKSVSP